MKSSEILRKSAKLVEDGKEYFGCHAISVVTEGRNDYYILEPDWDSTIMRRFRVVSPSKAREGDAWWEMEASGPRIIGLCLAAAIAESEGD